MIFKITLESLAPDAKKWERESATTSHWPSAEPMLDDVRRRFPQHKFRLVAELIDDPVSEKK